MAARKPQPKDLSPKDRVATTTHLAETVDYNAKHAFNHAKAVAKIAARLDDDHPLKATLLHNAEHTAKHAGDVVDHAKRLQQHLKGYPGSRAAMRDLMNPRPSDAPSPPKK